MQSTNDITLILGGTGKTGRRVAKQLTTRGVAVRTASRSGDVRFDWDQPATWAPALTGATSVYLAYHPDLALPGAAAHIDAFARLAVAHGVRRIVLLSGRGEPQVHPSEEAVRTCGAEYTVLRAAWFDQNFSEGYLREPVLAGEIAFPGGDAAEPFIDADDIAEVAALALTSDGHAGRTYDLTGPRLLTFAEAAAELTAAAGHAVRYTPISSQAYGEVLASFLPAPTAEFMRDLFAQLLDGHNSHVSGDVARVLGRPPRDFRDYARDAAAAGAWRR
ncbi:NAD(P)H-binding protein [Nannocystis punicea]|uniref:NAD(P)H-binding protein n=1 Tax=Nannocystis punicea TaxID=2995304 RepID=A0ABY7H8G6_9BACT|nr:NAD(P)H-binding protein [Nannocystis poenicansa]WAS95329.1 NAD(P)H-binding protein [Nannocystis poenicansa]